MTNATQRARYRMDRATAEHFYAWLFRYVAEDRQHDAEQKIHAFLADYPDMVDTHSWPDILTLAERFAS